ncbi:MAG: HAD family hydrolase [Gemmataceae bacterium]
MIRTIIFDFGNVIAFFDHHRIWKRWAPHAGISAEEMRERLVGSDLEDAYESGRVSTAELLRQVRALCQLRCSDEEIIEAYCDIFWPNPEVRELLPLLRPRYQLLVGSNTCELHAQRFRRQFADTLSHFQALVLSHEIGARKPHPPFYEHCWRQAGHAPSECLFIDDLPANVAGARACGLQAIQYSNSTPLHQQLTQLGIVLVAEERS